MAERKGSASARGGRPQKPSPRKSRSGPAKSGAVPKETKKSKSWPILFWLCFVILLLGLFLANREAISNSIETIKNQLTANKAIQSENPAPPAAEPNIQNDPPVNKIPVQPAAKPAVPSAAPSAMPPAVRQTTQPSKQTAAEQPAPAQPAKQTPAQTTPQTAVIPQAAAPKPASTPPAAEPAKTQSQIEQRERALYFIHVDRGGSILREKVSRKIPVSDSPMTDAIQAIITGPNGEEKQKDLISLIPPNTRILSATVKGDTAYISFSEDFQYNTYGVEGYAGQLRQVVFTATEFPNVKNVQILIEGRRVDYLGEGIWIGGPISRDML